MRWRHFCFLFCKVKCNVLQRTFRKWLWNLTHLNILRFLYARKGFIFQKYVGEGRIKLTILFWSMLPNRVFCGFLCDWGSGKVMYFVSWHNSPQRVLLFPSYFPPFPKLFSVWDIPKSMFPSRWLWIRVLNLPYAVGIWFYRAILSYVFSHSSFTRLGWLNKTGWLTIYCHWKTVTYEKLKPSLEKKMHRHIS